MPATANVAAALTLTALLIGFSLLWKAQNAPKANETTAKVNSAAKSLKNKDTAKKQVAKASRSRDHSPEPTKYKPIPLRILYGTQTGTAKAFADSLEKQIFALNVSGIHFQTSVVNLKDYDQDNLELECVVIVIMSTWTHGVPPKDAKVFCQWLQDMALDFRVPTTWLQNLHHAVFGLGNAEYDEHYCTASKQVYKDLETKGSTPLCALGMGDDNVDQEKQFDQWSEQCLFALCELFTSRTNKSGVATTAAAASSSPVTSKNKDAQDGGKWLSQKEYRRQKKLAQQQDANGEAGNKGDLLTEEDLMNEKVLHDDSTPSPTKQNKKASAKAKASSCGSDENGLVDVEDLGTSMQEAEAASLSREMITPMQRKALVKEGYKLIGTHSAVKLCRWTKHQLRGRGGCYKHTFYGITSYQCMETTPSLACANKCVFCWRHHKNPVGRVWRWKTDDAKQIVEEAIEKHQRMIKENKGLPGLIPERWQEAFTVKHCALSLVGEPIMYPQINEFCRELHMRGISSFLVTNAQFPEKIAELEPITQLYVSVDASTKDTLQQVDRPLFKDFWERFLACLQQLKAKGQRTVYRLTLVKSYNMNELAQYAELIKLGQPDFIEVKAVTYCGKSDGSDLTMQHVPWHEEVRNFCEALCGQVSDKYDLATEHSHSNCVLIAKKKFCIQGQWHTWIDYDKFQQLIAKYYQDGTVFRTEDYLAPTPSWALYNSPEQGFDPVETRFRRSKDGKVVEIPYEASESGCG